MVSDVVVFIFSAHFDLLYADEASNFREYNLYFIFLGHERKNEVTINICLIYCHVRFSSGIKRFKRNTERFYIFSPKKILVSFNLMCQIQNW